VQPLTGLPPGPEGLSGRPALVVKIDNHPQARPQAGLPDADVVIEEVVEGITRFFAIFQSRVPETVGPIRSARTQDALLVPMLGRPLFTWSGGNGGVRRTIAHANVVDLSAQRPEVYRGAGWFRDRKHVGPHNLFARGEGLYSFTPVYAGPPPPLFEYRTGSDPSPGLPTAGARLTMWSTKVDWVWDAGARTWVRWQNGRPHTATATVGGPDQPVTAANVVLIHVDYAPSAVDRRSPEAQTLGEGIAQVLVDGHVVSGRWTRLDPAGPWQLRDDQGNPILLQPGATWVELVKTGRVQFVAEGASVSDAPYPRW
jgi:hypothetical protein